MEIICREAYARAGLIGNPSDGYNGKTIAIIVGNFRAQVFLYEWEDVEIVLSEEDRTQFGSIADLAHDVDLHGYYGGVRLVKATVRRFYHHCVANNYKLHSRNFSIRYESDIPRQVGLAGSSGIIVATMRCLMDFYGVEIPLQVQPSLVLSVETEELKIPAGLQDRVIQVYEGVVYMDFSKDVMHERHGLVCGQYEPLSSSELPPIYIAYSTDFSEPTEIPHQNLRDRYDRGDREVLAAMFKFADLTDRAKLALGSGDREELRKVIDENFDTRSSIMPIAEKYREMVETARGVGASAKFAGSGGAIIGTYRDESMFGELKETLAAIQCVLIKPRVSMTTPRRS